MGKRQRAIKSSPLDHAIETRDLAVVDMVAAAIRHKDVLLAFQPIVQAKDPAKVAFFEGLIRVLDETGRIIPAKDFMATLENTDLGRQLDCLALEQGLKTLTQAPDIRISINMSARSIGYGRYTRTLEQALSERPEVARRLILEISEPSVLQVPEVVMDFMDNYQGRGIAFALDDYGAKLTSFRHLKEFFFDIVKVDRQFCQKISTDYENQVIAGAISHIARQFGIFTVATHVTSMDDANTLASLGFDCLQGFLYGAPTVNPPWAKNENSKKVA